MSGSERDPTEAVASTSASAADLPVSPGHGPSAATKVLPARPALRTRLSWLFEDLHLQATGSENPQVLWKIRRFGGRSQIRFPGGFTLPVDRSNYATIRKLVDLAAYGVTLGPLDRSDPHRWGVSLDSGLIETPTRIRFTLESLHPYVFAETFLYDIHFPGFDVRNRNVVDAGAFVGDTALYFAALGARVHSYEPEPGNVLRLRQNLQLNPELAALVTVHPEAVGLDGTVHFGVGEGGGGSTFRARAASVPTPAVSLRTILNRIDGAPYLLKLDCKGAEFDLVRQPALGEFSVVHIEYAADFRPGRTVGELLQALQNAGFSRIRRFKHNWGGYDFKICGMIQAER